MTNHFSDPVSGDRDAVLFFEARGLPAHSNVLYSDRESALAAPRGDIRLAFFPASGMVFNVDFDPRRMEYDEQYDNNLHHSPRFREFASALAAELVERYGLEEKTIVEIGCGKGRFLELLCRAGRNRGFGFDRSYEGPERRDDVDLTFVRDWYGERYTDLRPDFVCSQHVLEHIDVPLEFVRAIRKAIGDRAEAAVYCEVPDAMWTLRDLGIWDIIYEHCSYFTPPSLGRAFEEGGFEVLRLESRFGGQFLSVEARPANRSSITDRSREIEEVGRLAESFGERHRSRVAEWSERLERWANEGRRVVAWGAGSKGVTFLNSVPGATLVEAIVDLNPNKQGRFVPGAAQPIIAPESLVARKPDAVILMNPNYRTEIERQLDELGIDAELCPV